MPATALRILARSDPGPAAPAGARQIADFMTGVSFEAAHVTAADIGTLQRVAPPHSRVYLTAIPGRMPNHTMVDAARLRAAGFEPVPHLATRGLADAAMLDEVVSRMVKVGVRRLMIIAGDHDRAVGPYGQALDVIESGLLQRHGIVEVGVAGYPEGHPRIATEALDRALAAKIEAAGQTGLALDIVTQFGFEPAAVLRWISRLRDLGVEHPVRIGLSGPTDLATALRYARRCGVRVSAQSIARNAGLAKRLTGVSAPDGMIRALAEAATKNRLGRIAPHLYSFGALAATGRWAAAVADGRIVLDRADGFGVEAP